MSRSAIDRPHPAVPGASLSSLLQLPFPDSQTPLIGQSAPPTTYPRTPPPLRVVPRIYITTTTSTFKHNGLSARTACIESTRPINKIAGIPSVNCFITCSWTTGSVSSRRPQPALSIISHVVLQGQCGRIDVGTTSGPFLVAIYNNRFSDRQPYFHE